MTAPTGRQNRNHGGRTASPLFQKRSPANAALITAAPDLYDALNTLVLWKKHKDEVGKTDSYRYQIGAAWEKARAALARARGEQP